jgi:hypothetical protein
MITNDATAKDADALYASATELFVRGEFEAARATFELAFLFRSPPATRLLLYAICLAELGHDDDAKDAFALVKEVVSTLDVDSAARIAFDDFLDEVDRLIACSLSKGARDTLKTEAERFFPRAKR